MKTKVTVYKVKGNEYMETRACNEKEDIVYGIKKSNMKNPLFV